DQASRLKRRRPGEPSPGRSTFQERTAPAGGQELPKAAMPPRPQGVLRVKRPGDQTGSVGAALARDVVLGAWQLAAANVAEQLLENGQLAPAGRGLAAVHGDPLPVIEAQGPD